MTQETNYDSAQETNEHILRVRELLYIVQNKLEERGFAHDQSKLGTVEKPIFDRVSARLKQLTYGSDEYRQSLIDLGPALQHHYEHNSHHPEHFRTQQCIICFATYPKDYRSNCRECGNGTMTSQFSISGMSLLDLIEMLCDWMAAGERHADGSMSRSLEINRKRFQIEPQLQSILENTARELGWVKT